MDGKTEVSNKMLIASLALVAVLFMIVMGLSFTINKKNALMEKLDNRPRPWLGSMRDDTGAKNAYHLFGYGHGLEQTKEGAKMVDDRFDLYKGKLTMSKDGLTQSEYGKTMESESEKMVAKPRPPVMRESLDSKESMTTEKKLQD